VSEPTFVPLNVGDTEDDDGQVIDSLLVEVDAPPEPLPDTSVEPQRSKVRPAKTGKLLTGTMLVLPGWDAIPLLPADPDRDTFRLQVIGATATDYILYADDAGKLQNEQGGFRVMATVTGNRVDVDNFTGPLWVKAPAANNVAGVYVSWSAVTE
jgi:hypothetical protein